VTWQNKTYYLGKMNTPESWLRYAKIVATIPCPELPVEIPEMPEPSPGSVLTVRDVVLRFLKHARQYYVDSQGEQTGEASTVKSALTPIVRRFGETSAAGSDQRSSKPSKPTMSL
jgi:hypothetical protein